MKISIRLKLIIGITIIFIAAYILLFLTVSSSIKRNNTATIEKDIQSHVYDLGIYIKQYIKNSEMDVDEQSFELYANELGRLLSIKDNERIILYDRDGLFLYDSIGWGGQTSMGNMQDDIGKALGNKSGYAILNENKELWVAVSTPVVFDNVRVGIVRYIFDYTQLIHTSDQLLRTIIWPMILIFVVVCGFIIFLSGRITKPIIDMKDATTEMAKGNFDSILEVRTRDEIKDLADNFNEMKESIKGHIEKIESQRDDLIKLQAHKKTFFDNVTHELKTPLTVISGYAQILQDYGAEDEAMLNRTLHNIKSETDKMHHMIQELLSVAKAESDVEYHFKDVSLGDIVSEQVQSLKTKYQDRPPVIHWHPKESITIHGDGLKLGQAIFNILDNAVKYSTERADITITMGQEGDENRLNIQDRGMGIPQEALQHLFKPFYRVDRRRRESTGLGLHIAHMIMERHKGRIEVESTEGVGTTFHLIF